MRYYTAFLVCGIGLGVFAAEPSYVSYARAKVVLDHTGESLPAELQNPTAAKWNAWTKKQDATIRARLEQGNLDSMVNLLLYGNSFTKQPRIKVENLGEASRAGILRARVDDLTAGIRKPGDNERLVFLNALLRRQGIDPEDTGKTGVFLYTNLQRVIQEMSTLSKTAQEANQLPNAAAIFNWREGMMRDRGVSLDTSIFPNYSIDQALRELKSKGVLRDGEVRRIAVVGPGLDFSDKNEAMSYDYYPQQTLQPFALYDSLLRLELAKPNALKLTILDISSRVIDHVERARDRAKKGTGPVIQLPRELGKQWPPDLAAYWRSLGDRIGTAVDPIHPPQTLEARAIAIRPDVMLALQPLALNIVLQRLDLPDADRFDLIVGTNIFIYYGAMERSLALENAGAMLKRGGLLLTNDRLPEVAGGAMRQAGLTEVPYNRDAVGWYQKQ